MFRSSHIFVFWFLVFWSLQLRDFLSLFSRLANLALSNENKDSVIVVYFCNFVAKSDQKPKNEKSDERNIGLQSRIQNQLDFFYSNQILLMFVRCHTSTSEAKATAHTGQDALGHRHFLNVCPKPRCIMGPQPFHTTQE